MLTDSDIFAFKPESSTLVLKSTSLLSVVSGELCAENRVITLEFSLESDKLGQTTQTLKFSILKADSESGSLTFKKDVTKLKVSSIEINQIGQLDIFFSKPIVKHDLFTAGGFNIDWLVDLYVKDAEYYDNLDKSIASFELKELTDRVLSLNVQFNDPLAITPDLLDPDSLAVTFLLPELIIDQENYETI